MLQELLELTSHHHITKAYRRIPDQLHNAGGQNDLGNQWKVIFLFQSMNIPGLAVNHEDILRDINRTLNWLIANQKPRYVHNLIQKTFSILKVNATRFPSTSVTCVDNMGREIFQTGNRELIDYFIDAVIDLGFQPPMIRGVGNDWQIQSNGAHIQNIRTWMNLIQLQPGKSIRLFSNLIIHLAVSGVFIKDTDLFGRDITRFFNSGIAEVYNLCKQLARLFPVYFNDIGAEGDLRDISTRIDEICHRRDPLIHFLRKQSHVESSNRIIGFMDAILQLPNFEAILFITHDLDLAVCYANRVILVHEGRIAADGPPPEVLAQRELLERCRVVPTSLLTANLERLPQTGRFMRAELLAHVRPQYDGSHRKPIGGLPLDCKTNSLKEVPNVNRQE